MLKVIVTPSGTGVSVATMTSTSSAAASGPSNGSKIGGIVGGVIGGTLVLASAVSFVIYLNRRKLSRVPKEQVMTEDGLANIGTRRQPMEQSSEIV